MSRKVRFLSLISICAITFMIAGYFVNHFVNAEEETEFQIGGPFELTRHTGEVISSEVFRGRYMFIYFGFTHCPATCPVTLNDMTVVLRKLEKANPGLAEKISPIFISVDPERDTPELIGKYISHFHNRFEGMTGRYDELVEIVNSYGSYFSYDQADSDGNYNVNHSSYIYLMGPEGEYVTHFTPDETVDQILEYLLNV